MTMFSISQDSDLQRFWSEGERKRGSDAAIAGDEPWMTGVGTIRKMALVAKNADG